MADKDTTEWTLQSDAQKQDLRQVMVLLSLREHHAKALLMYCDWDLLKLCELLIRKGKDQLYAEAGFTEEAEQRIFSLPRDLVMCNHCLKYIKFSPHPRNLSRVECSKCFQKVSPDVMTTMNCGHGFCNFCWTEYFVVKINENQNRRIRCMSDRCNSICDEAKIKSLAFARNPKLAEKFECSLLGSFIEDTWCSNDCGIPLCLQNDKPCDVGCPCNQRQFCFSCSNVARLPSSCMIWALWAMEYKAKSQTIEGKTANTKPCPKCHKPVGRDGLSNLVACKCGQGFCWLCNWDTSLGAGTDEHNCDRYTEDLENKAELRKEHPWRYMHYRNRYNAYAELFELEPMLYETGLKMIDKLEERDDLTQRDGDWLTNGLYRIFNSTRLLAYSYAFAYYMFGDMVKDTIPAAKRIKNETSFNGQQQQLEAKIEELSMLLLEPFHLFSTDGINKTKLYIVDLSIIVDELCKKMCTSIEDAFKVHEQNGKRCSLPAPRNIPRQLLCQQVQQVEAYKEQSCQSRLKSLNLKKCLDCLTFVSDKLVPFAGLIMEGLVAPRLGREGIFREIKLTIAVIILLRSTRDMVKTYVNNPQRVFTWSLFQFSHAAVGVVTAGMELSSSIRETEANYHLDFTALLSSFFTFVSCLFK